MTDAQWVVVYWVFLDAGMDFLGDLCCISISVELDRIDLGARDSVTCRVNDKCCILNLAVVLMLWLIVYCTLSKGSPAFFPLRPLR